MLENLLDDLDLDDDGRKDVKEQLLPLFDRAVASATRLFASVDKGALAKIMDLGAEVLAKVEELIAQVKLVVHPDELKKELAEQAAIAKELLSYIKDAFQKDAEEKAKKK